MLHSGLQSYFSVCEIVVRDISPSDQSNVAGLSEKEMTMKLFPDTLVISSLRDAIAAHPGTEDLYSDPFMESKQCLTDHGLVSHAPVCLHRSIAL